MPCYHPLRGFRKPFPEQNGKFRITGIRARSREDSAPPGAVAVDLPCGQCIGCRLDRSRKWAVRCLHEASLYDDNCFVTLTYSDDCLPQFGALDVRPLQLFIKRLRKREGAGIRFYACGEYGENFGRPHYHACIFNYDFPDKSLWQVRDDVSLYVSDSLKSLWPFGFSTVGDVTFQSAAYVARYIMKKVTGDKALPHYTRLVPETGELVSISSEFTVMSRRPGIGKPWLDKYMSDVFPDDFVVVNGKKQSVPRFYDQQLEKFNPELYQDIKSDRVEVGFSRRANSTLSRLKVRETVSKSRIKQLKRVL